MRSRNAFLLGGGMAAVLLGMTLSVQAESIVLLDDSFEDGDRTDTNLPDESALYVGDTDPPEFSVSPGAATWDFPSRSTSSRKMWTYFTPNGAPIVLGVGDKLSAAATFSVSETFENTSRGLRMGLFHDPTDNQIVVDTNDDGGGVGDMGQSDPWTDSTGYGLQSLTSTSLDPPSPFRIGKRTNLTNNSLLGSSGAYTFAGSDGEDIVGSEGSEYTYVMNVEKLAADQVLVTMEGYLEGVLVSTASALDDSTASTFGGEASSQPVYDTFDHLFFRFSGEQVGGGLIEFTNLNVTLTRVPEPTSAVLGVLALASLAVRRRAR